MKAMTLLNGKFSLVSAADPIPEAGQIIARPLACGVCGSDLHARDHADHLCDLLHRAGFRAFMDPRQPVVMGHEFCCEVLETKGDLQSGMRVVALPFLQGQNGPELLGYSNRFNGAFADMMLLQADAAIPVPDHVETEIAALTEPLSVAVHAVNVAGADPDCAFAVFGCGPVGLFVIARLRALGLGPILAIEPNEARRAMAERMGADRVLPPDDVSSGTWWSSLGLPLGVSDAMAQAPELRKRSRAILFDCVGKPGVLMAIARAAPVGATITVIGTCMETDNLEPAFLLQKALQLRFVFAYSPDEFREALAMISADPERMRPMVTGSVPMIEVDRAFAALAGGGADVKLMVVPQ